MADTNWKAEERRVAKIYGVERRLMKGTKEKADIGDDDFPLMLDVKLRKKENWRVTGWFMDIDKAAKEAGKLPVLSLREPGKGSKIRYAVVRESTLSRFISGSTKFVGDNFFTASTRPSPGTPIIDPWKKLIKLYNQKRMEMMSTLVFHQESYSVVIPILLHENTKVGIKFAILSTENHAFILKEGGLLKDSE